MKRKMGNETPHHVALKSIAMAILKEKGFEPFEIKNEYSVCYNGENKYVNNKYIVDVVGIKKDRKIAIECGSVGFSKITNLKKIFDEVIVVNNATIFDFYERWKKAYFELQKENDSLKEYVDNIKNEANRRIYEVNSRMAEVEKENRSLKYRMGFIQREIAKAWKATKELS